jgi:class I fructose-bisphosphate aldolase/fructose-bisphosphate aldolase/2-amino-3,7-dideoxy-D-threo-hept-6-ulosonate synthase
MAFLGKEIRLKRLLNAKSGKLLAITVDHSIARGIQTGLIPIQKTIDRIVGGAPDAITMHKGIAEQCFGPHAGKISLILKCSSFSPYQPGFDTWVTDVEEAVRMGAEAASMGCILGGPEQPEQLRQLGLMAKQAASFGMPLVAHIYPRGSFIEKKDQYTWKNVAYAVRAGAELGVDVIKTNYTGSPDTFAKVVEACPARVVVAGGEVGNRIEDYLRMTRDLMDVGAAGVTYGRFVWEYEHIPELIKALKFIIHDNGSFADAVKLLDDLVKSKK